MADFTFEVENALLDRLEMIAVERRTTVEALVVAAFEEKFGGDLSAATVEVAR